MNISRLIRELILEGFGEEDLRTLCFDLGVEYDDLPAEGRANKARELVIYMNNRRRTAELLTLCAERRPLLPWPEHVEPDPGELEPGDPSDFFDDQPEVPGGEGQAPPPPVVDVRPALWKEPHGEPDWVTVPAGPFWLGWEEGRNNERPSHQLDLETFFIARYPITNVQYRLFVTNTNYHKPGHWFEGQIPTGYENHPVRFVSYYDAQAYCRWLSRMIGREVSLPSEAQWEKAARGSEPDFLFPWGKVSDASRANTSEAKRESTTPVDRFPDGASPFGVRDMCGNVWEWTLSAYKPYPYHAQDGRERDGDSSRVLRGGAFNTSQNIARCAYRTWDKPDVRQSDDGFRVIARLE